MVASQSARLFSSQGTDQGVGHFKGRLNCEILQMHWSVFPEKSHDAPQKLGRIAFTMLPIPGKTSHF